MQKKLMTSLDSLFLGNNILNPVFNIFDYLLYHLFYKFYYKSRFKFYGKNIRWGRDFKKRVIPSSVRISCPQKIEIGDNVKIDEGVFIQCDSSNLNSSVSIGKSSRINAHTHLLSGDEIIIGEEVLIAPFVLIASNNHKHDSDSSVMAQGMKSSGPIKIENGAWIAQGAFILGGSIIKKNAVVGAGVKLSKQVVEKGNSLK